MVAINKDIKLKTFKDLIAWQKAYELCLLIFKSSKSFPRSEQFGLCSQMKRSALSVPSNIAEGFSRPSKPNYLRFLYIAYASLSELETQLLLAKDMEYLDETNFNKIHEIRGETQRIMYGLIKALKQL